MIVDRCIEVFINLAYSDLNEPAREPTSKDGNLREVSRSLALKDLTLSIEPGEKVAICGRSGRYIHLFLPRPAPTNKLQ